MDPLPLATGTRTTAVRPVDAQRPDLSRTLGADGAAQAATLLKAVADPLRLRMLSLVAATPGGEACVCDLATVGDVSQPTVSHHLKVLKDAGVLSSERRGTWVYYKVTDECAPAVSVLLDALVPAAQTREPAQRP